MEDGANGAKVKNRVHGMSTQTRQQIVALLQGIQERSPRSIKEMREARREVASLVASKFKKSVGTILNPVVRKAGHSSADAFDRLALAWLEGDGSVLLASILGSDPANWDQQDANAI